MHGAVCVIVAVAAFFNDLFLKLKRVKVQENENICFLLT